PCRSNLCSETIDHEKANVVTRVCVFGAGIAQAGDQTNPRRSLLVQVDSIANRNSQFAIQAHFFASFSFGAGAAGAPFAAAAGAPFPGGPGAAAPPSSFFPLITSGPAPAAASASATTGSSSTTGARTENAVRSACAFTVTPAGR